MISPCWCTTNRELPALPHACVETLKAGTAREAWRGGAVGEVGLQSSFNSTQHVQFVSWLHRRVSPEPSADCSPPGLCSLPEPALCSVNASKHHLPLPFNLTLPFPCTNAILRSRWSPACVLSCPVFSYLPHTVLAWLSQLLLPDFWADWPLALLVMATVQIVGLLELTHPSKQASAYLLNFIPIIQSKACVIFHFGKSRGKD